jgi:uncharacterized protein
LHHADGPEAIVLAHGAGSDCNSRLIVAMSEAFARAGVSALRLDLPFRQERPGGSPHPSKAGRDREALREATRMLGNRRIYLGGHSYGGRQAIMLAAEDPSVAAALLLISYPLHPPRKPEQLRTAHFPTLRVPAYFIHGSRDPFGSPDEMQEALGLLASPFILHGMEGAGHEAKTALNKPDEFIRDFLTWANSGAASS